jgi:hypothetical protein
VYKRESGLINPLEQVKSILGDSIQVELGSPQINENQTDEFCDVSASKSSHITSAFLLGS